MNIAPHPLRERRTASSPRRRRRRNAAVSIASGLGVVAGLVLVYAAVLGPSQAGTQPLLAGFEARSYVPGEVAELNISGSGTSRATLQIFVAGASGSTGTALPDEAPGGWDRTTF